MQDLKAAMKAQDDAAKRGIRAIKQAILLAKTDAKQEAITPEKEMQMLQKLIKQRRESLEIFEREGRAELAKTEQEEIDIIERYLPKQLSPEEIEAAVKAVITATGASSIRDMGKVMGQASQQLAGKADNKLIAEIVKKLLGA